MMNRKPPVGVVPEFIWKEARLSDLIDCMKRYLNGCYPLNPEWVEEYNKLVLEREKENAALVYVQEESGNAN